LSFAARVVLSSTRADLLCAFAGRTRGQPTAGRRLSWRQHGRGTDALFSRSSGVWNTALGFKALNHDTVGGGNTATGFQSLFNNSSGNQNTAYGSESLYRSTFSSWNTAIGYRALYSNHEGANNTATGAYALYTNSEGVGNTAIGNSALSHNELGNANTATGNHALFKNTTAHDNTATGAGALFSNTTGSNTATGVGSLYSNTTGDGNTAEGNNSLMNNTTGSGNIALGSTAGLNLTTGDSNIDIGNQGVAGEANTIRIGSGLQTRAFIGGISGVAVAGDPVVVNSSGQLGVGMPSSKRFKGEIKPMGDASEAILGLKPVTFRYKNDLDPKRITRFGLVAEEVEKVNRDLVARDAKSEPYPVRYEAVNAMLLNEFLKEHRKVEEQEATITQLNKDFRTAVTQLTARLDEQASQIQKVNAQLAAASPSRGGLEASKAESQVASNP